MIFIKEQGENIYFGDYKDIYCLSRKKTPINDLMGKRPFVTTNSFIKISNLELGIICVTDCSKSIPEYIRRCIEDNICKWYIIDFFDISILINSSMADCIPYISEWYRKSLKIFLFDPVNIECGNIYFERTNYARLYRKLHRSYKGITEITYFDKFQNRIFNNPISACDIRRDFTKIRVLGIVESTDESKKVLRMPIGRFAPIVSIEKTKRGIVKTCKAITNGGNGVYFDTQSGKGFRKSKAVNSALGESVERFLATRFDGDKTLKASYNDLIKIYKTIPLSIKNDNPNEIREWVWGTDLKKAEAKLVDARLVFFPYKDDYVDGTTTGLCASTSVPKAIEGAVIEIVERDAYSITYRANKKPIMIERKEISCRNRRIINKLKRRGIRCHLVLLETDVNIKIVHCTFESLDRKFPIYTHGSCGSFNLNKSIEGAIAECFQLRQSQIELMADNQMGYPENEAYLEWGKGNIDYCKVFLQDYAISKRNELEDIRDLQGLIDAMPEVICVDLSSDGCPIKVVRVIVPMFQDIDNNKMRTTERLLEIVDYDKEKINNRMLFT
ncbi:MAG: hypothetical protein E7296_10145 [Lachnospiraceae bacterium]|jgi:thiazole/oxazole-forming peptide maturase SagD family component|nr:hypothetical protein [Lachnospiraceae bacterium]